MALQVDVDRGHRVSGFLILFVHAWWDSLGEKPARSEVNRKPEKDGYTHVYVPAEVETRSCDRAIEGI